MPESDSLLYETLATQYAQRDEARPRDHCLVLAADAALNAGQPDQAERVRQRLLAVNPNHWLRPFDSMREAMHSDDVRDLVADLRRQWPPEAVKKLLRESGVVETTPVKREEKAPPIFVAAPIQETAPVKPKKSARAAPVVDNDDFAEPTALGSALATLVFLIGVVLAASVLFVAVGWPWVKH